MAYGTVNVPGVNQQELNAVSTAVQTAQRTADEAKAAAQKAQGTADSAKTAAVVMKPATASTAGAAGLAPAPAAGAQNKYLRGDGTWQTPPDTNTTYSNMGAATASAAGKSGLVPAPAAGAQGKYLRGDGTWQTPPDTNTTYTPASAAPKANGTAAVGTSVKYAREDHVHPAQTSLSGNAATATKLATPRTINGTSFDGSANITTANWGTARNITIGNATKSINGSANISFTLAEIGAGTATKLFAAGTTAPADKGLFWVDTTAGTGGLKYHNGTAWVHVPVAYT